jgi:hypothetical protein
MQPGWKAKPDDPVQLVGLCEIADRLQVQRSTVDQWRHRHVLPAPDFDLRSGPIWWWSTIRQWATMTGRL